MRGHRILLVFAATFISPFFVFGKIISSGFHAKCSVPIQCNGLDTSQKNINYYDFLKQSLHHDAIKILYPDSVASESLLFRAYSETEQDDFLIENSQAIVMLYNKFEPNVGTDDNTLTLGDALTGGNISTAISGGSNNSFVDWSPDGKYLAVSGAFTAGPSHNLRIYELDTDHFQLTELVTASVFSGVEICCKWSPDGNYIAAATVGTASPQGSVYSFAGERLTELEGCRFSHGGTLYGLDWAPSGEFLTMSGARVSNVSVRNFAFDGVQFTRQYTIDPGEDSRVIAWNPGGHYLVVGLDGGVSASPMKLYSFENDEIGFSLVTSLANANEDTYSLAWTPDGRHLARASMLNTTTDAKLDVYRFWGDSLGIVATLIFDIAHHLDAIDWSADGNYISAGYSTDAGWTQGTVYIYKFDGSSLKVLEGCHLTDIGAPEDISWNKVYPIISTVSNGSTNNIQSYYFEYSGKDEELIELSGCNRVFANGALDANWSPDGRYLALSNYTSGASDTLHVYELFNGTLVERDSFVHGAHVYGVKWHPSGRYIAICGEDGTGSYNIRVFFFDGYALTVLPGCNIARTTSLEPSLDWHQHGNYLAVAGWGSVLKCYEFKNETLTEVASYSPGGTLGAVKWHPNDSMLALGGTNLLHVLRFNGSAFSLVDSYSISGYVSSVRWNLRGDYLAVCGSSALTYELEIVFFDGINLLSLPNSQLHVSDENLSFVEWYNNQYLIVTGVGSLYGNELEIYRFCDEKLTFLSGKVLGGWSSAIAIHPSGEYVVIGNGSAATDGYHLHMYPIEEGKTLQQRLYDSENKVESFTAEVASLEAEITTHSNVIIKLKSDQTTDLQGFLDKTNTGSFVLTETTVNAIDWSRDGKYVAVGKDDVRGGAHLQIFLNDGSALSNYLDLDLGTTTTIKDVAWHPNGEHLAIAAASVPSISDGADAIVHEVRVFELTSTGLEEMPGCYRVGSGISSTIETIESVAWSPNGNYLAIGGYAPSQQVKIYAFDHAYTLSELSSIVIDYGSSTTVRAIDWAATGSYSTLALAGDKGANDARLKLYAFGYDLLSADTYGVSALPNAYYEYCNTRKDVAWSPDGTKIATVGWAGIDGCEVMAFNYSLSSQSLEHLGMCDFVHSGTANSVAWSPDGSKLAVTGWNFADGATHSRVFKFTENNALDEVEDCRIDEAGGAGNSIVWAPDGFSLVLAGTTDGDGAGIKIKSLDFETLKEYTLTDTKELRLGFALSSPPTFSNNIEEVEWSPDARYLAAVTTDNDLIVYGFDGLTFTQKGIESFGTNLAAVAWHPDRKHIFICGGEGTGSNNVRLYTFISESLSLVDSFDPGSVTMRDISVHPSGKFVVAALDSEIRLYGFDPSNSTFNDTHLQSVAHGGLVYTAQWSPSGKYVLLSGADAASGNYNVRIYEFDGEDTLTEISGASLDLSITAAISGRWSEDENYVSLACSADGVKILCFDGTTLSLLTTIAYSALDVCWSMDGQYLAFSGVSFVRMVKFNGTAATEMLGSYVAQSDGNINSIHFSPDDRLLVAGGAGSDKFECYPTNFETLIEANSNAIIGVDPIFELVVNNSDSMDLVVTNSDALVNLSVLEKANSEAIMDQGSELYEVRLEDAMPGCTKNPLASVNSLDWSPSGSYLAVGHANSAAQDDNVNVRVYAFNLFDETLTELPDCKKIHGASVTGVVWRPDGEFLAITGEPDSTTGVRIYKLIGRRLSEVAIADLDSNTPSSGERISWSPNGSFLAIGWDETGINGVRVYEFDDTDGAESLTLRDSEAHGASVYYVEWSPDGQYLLAGGDPSFSGSYEVRVYSFDYVTKTLTELTGCRLNLATCDRVWHGTWHPSGDFVAIGGVNDDVINIYNFDGTNLTLVHSKAVSAFDSRHIDWTSNGLFLVHAAAASSDNIRVYKFNANNLEEMERGTKDLGGTLVHCVKFNSNGSFLAAGGDNSSSRISIYPVVQESLIQANSDVIATFHDLPTENQNAVLELENRLTALEALVDDNADAIGTDALEAYLDSEDTAISTLLTDIGNAEPIIEDNSWAVLNLTERLSADSSAIITLDLLAIATSNAIVVHATYMPYISENSWAILNLDEREIADSMAIANLDERELADSNALFAIQAELFPGDPVYVDPSLVYENSWAAEALSIRLGVDEEILIANSWAILNLDERESTNSSAIVHFQAEVFPGDPVYADPSLIYENSWSVESLDERLGSAETQISTNAGDITLLDGRITTNEGTISTHDGEITTLQGEVVSLQDEAGFIDNNLADLWFDSNTTLSYDISLSGDHKMHILENLTLNGAGHSISFPRSADDVLTVADSKTVTFENCLLKRYSETNISRGTSADIIFGTGTRVGLSADEDLAETWKFNGSSQLSGNGKTLDLSSGGGITVQAGADLTISNLTVAGLLGTNLSCVDDDASIKCRNVNFKIPSAYNFEHGSLQIGEQVNVSGKGIFVYESPETSTLLSQSELKFGPEMTFSYDPSTTFDHLLYFTDSTSVLHLDGMNLYVTWTGLELKTGTLKLTGKNYSYNDATATLIGSEPPKHGLTLGSGVEAENLYVDIRPGASLQLASGQVDYRNVESI